jgi:hypothetical protein
MWTMRLAHIPVNSTGCFSPMPGLNANDFVQNIRYKDCIVFSCSNEKADA